MGMKHILRALDQALETAEIERKYLRDELEAERVEKQRLAAEMDAAAEVMARGTQGGAGTSCWKPSGSGNDDLGRGCGRTWPGSCGRCAGTRSACRAAVDSLESENAKLREALEKWKKSR